MKGPWVTMIYDREADCWTVRKAGGTYAVHCGECFEIRVGDRGIRCRLELDRNWYVIMREARFNLRSKDIYQVRFV
ncbi:DUF5348 domain-containing protein [Paenibacillus thermoaerophilus]|jgi:hypothetical protein|uniref:DUF5348 domain-containing protein n=2 Tax=Paenibacillaceae TaxID=186822 RepID=A0ABW2V9M2_9BACL|nr:hypothetical protein FE781_16585 [Paenibacillus thermoaerophilus]